jgi:hypothetical protein
MFKRAGRYPPKPSNLRKAFEADGIPESSWVWAAFFAPKPVWVAWEVGRDPVQAEIDRLDAAERSANKGKPL